MSSAQDWETRPPRKGEGRGGANRSGRAFPCRRADVRGHPVRLLVPGSSSVRLPRGLVAFFSPGIVVLELDLQPPRADLTPFPAPRPPEWARPPREGERGRPGARAREGAPRAGTAVGSQSRVAPPPTLPWAPPAPRWVLRLQALPPKPQWPRACFLISWHGPRPEEVGAFLEKGLNPYNAEK